MRNKLLVAGVPLLAIMASDAGATSFGTFDPRSMAMGGAGVAAGTSANASFYNPALLAAAKNGENFSIELPVIGVRVADPDDLVDNLDEFQDNNYIDNFSAAVDQWNSAVTPAQLLTAKDAVVAAGTDLVAGLQTLSDRALQGEANAGMVVAIPNKRVGAAFHVNARAMGGALLEVTQSDVDAFNAVIDGLNTNNLAAIVDPGTGDLIDPTDTLTSTVQGRGVVLTEAGVSLAREFSLAGHPVAVGVTPKYVRVDTFDYMADVDTADISVDEGEKSYSDFNFDVGIAHQYSNGWKTGVVVKNVIPQEYATMLGNTIEVEPQLRVGLAYENQSLTVAADLDVIENDAAGFDSPTQFLAVGAEWNAWNLLQLRAGYRHNISDSDTSSAALGFGISPFGAHFDLAVVGSSDEVGVGMQLGFRF